MNEPQDYSFTYVPPRADALDFDGRVEIPMPMMQPAPESEIGPKPAPEPAAPADPPVPAPETITEPAPVEEAKATHPTKAPTPQLPKKTVQARATRKSAKPASADEDELDDTMF